MNNNSNSKNTDSNIDKNRRSYKSSNYSKKDSYNQSKNVGSGENKGGKTSNSNINNKASQSKTSTSNKNLNNKQNYSKRSPELNSNSTLGSYLQEARNSAGYSLNQVASATKLNIHYIEAIERDDYKNAPPLVYVKAYIKKLCQFYNIDGKEALSLFNPGEDNQSNIAPEIYEKLEQNKQVNQEEERKILFFVKIILGSIIAIIAIIFIYFYFSSDNGTSSEKSNMKNKKQSDLPQKTEKLITPKSIELTKLSIPNKKEEN